MNKIKTPLLTLVVMGQPDRCMHSWGEPAFGQPHALTPLGGEWMKRSPMHSLLRGEWDGGVGGERRAIVACTFPGIWLAFGQLKLSCYFFSSDGSAIFGLENIFL